MKWFDYVLIIILPLMWGVVNPLFFSFMATDSFVIIYNLYAGVITYLLFKSWSDFRSAFKKVLIIGIISLIISSIISFIISTLSRKIEALAASSNSLYGGGIVSMFGVVNWWVVFASGLIFILMPLLISYLEYLTPVSENGFVRNNYLVFIYSVLTLGLYQLYWLWLIKKALAKLNISVISLWWFLLPGIGSILFYSSFSRALEQITQRKYNSLFLILFLLSGGLNVTIIQTFLNKKYLI